MSSQRKRPAIGLEGMVATLTVLKIGSDDVGALREELTDKVAQMPGFFHDGPLVLDLAGIEGSLDDDEAAPLSSLSLSALVELVRGKGLRLFGIRNPRADRIAEAERLGLSVLRSGPVRPTPRRPVEPSEPQAEPVAAIDEVSGEVPVAQVVEGAEPGEAPRTVVVKTPVRGGQVVYAAGTDAIAMAAVNPGGELIADGHVHVYGPLRGRAVAGVRGDTSARIFCQSLDAEVVSIAGVFMGADDLPSQFRGKPAQISLRDDQLVVEAL